MTRRPLHRSPLIPCLVGIGLLAGLRVASAQEEGSIVEGPGIKVGEGSVLHPVIGAETGVLSNVFFEDADTNLSGMLRLIAEFGIGSLPNQRLATPRDESGDETSSPKPTNEGDIRFRFDARFAYEEFLSSNETVRGNRDLSFGLRLRGLLRPQRTIAVGVENELRRETRPTNFESEIGTDRDINRLLLRMLYQPTGRSLTGHLRLQNVIDYFEAGRQQFANRMQNTLGIRADYRWFPATTLFTDASLGFFGGLGSSSTKVSSMPLRILAGTQTVLTVDTTLNLRIGFGKGFYASGPDFTNVIFGAQFGYRFSPQGRLTVMYDYDFADSINANFYRDHTVKAEYTQQVDRLTFSAGGELRLRSYRGVLAEVGGSAMDRSDLIFMVPISASYNFRDWLAGTADYHFVTDQTDFRYMTDGIVDDPSYTRHEVLLGVRAAL